MTRSRIDKTPSMIVSKLCPLCLHSELLIESHIIPEFLYPRLYDDKHRIFTFSDGVKQPGPPLQKGLKEPLLCRGCDGGILNERYEKGYFLKEWRDSGKFPDELAPDQQQITIRVDYAKFKLFLLSVLWRAHCSTLKIFEEVKLGVHASRIREMILSEDPGPEERYGILGFLYVDSKNRVVKDFISNPKSMKIEGHNAYRWTFGGMKLFLIVSSHLRKNAYSNLLKDDGTFILARAELRQDPDAIMALPRSLL